MFEELFSEYLLADDKDNFEQLVRRWMQGQGFHIEIRTIIGGTTDPLRLRFDSYFVAPFLLLIKLNDIKKAWFEEHDVKLTTPRLMIGSAHSMATHANEEKMPADKVVPNAREMLKRMDFLVKTCVPWLSEQVDIVHDTDSTWNGKVLSWMEAKSRHLTEELLVEIQKMGETRGGPTGRDKAPLYAAAHCLAHGDIVYRQHLGTTFQRFESSSPWLPVAENPRLDPTSVGIISVGGSPERTFIKVRKLLASAPEVLEGFVAMPHHARLISVAGHHAVYYAQSPHDLSLDDAKGKDVNQIIESCKSDSAVGKNDFKVWKRFQLSLVARHNDFHDCKELCYAVVVVLTCASHLLDSDRHGDLLKRFEKVEGKIGIGRADLAAGWKAKFSKDKEAKIKDICDRLPEWRDVYTEVEREVKLKTSLLTHIQEILQDKLHLRHLEQIGLEPEPEPVASLHA